MCDFTQDCDDSDFGPDAEDFDFVDSILDVAESDFEDFPQDLPAPAPEPMVHPVFENILKSFRL